MFAYPVFPSGLCLPAQSACQVENYHYKNSYDLIVRIIQKYTNRDV